MSKNTLNEIQINRVTYRPAVDVSQSRSNLVIVRTYSAGVFVGEMDGELNGTQLTLKNARNIWRWRGANTLMELSQEGVVTSEYTRISKTVPEILLTEVIQILPVSEKAAKTLEPVWND